MQLDFLFNKEEEKFFRDRKSFQQAKMQELQKNEKTTDVWGFKLLMLNKKRESCKMKEDNKSQKQIGGRSSNAGIEWEAITKMNIKGSENYQGDGSLKGQIKKSIFILNTQNQ